MDVIGRHDKPVKCVEYSDVAGLVVSGSWDMTVKAWDPRASPDQRCVATLGLPGKAFSLSVVQDKLVVATGGRRVNIYDMRNLSTPLQERESSLKYQTRCIRIYPDATGYAMSSVEGRVAMEYFDTGEEAQAKKYAFKCHRRNEGGRDIVYPVNAVAFHPVFGTFATGGCDGMVNVWDGNNKKRLYQFARYPTSIASLAFNRDGTMLAVASSYTYEEGEKDHDIERIFIRNVNEAEVKPKPKAGG
mmetsp:Transcript_63818/g.201881  ORF Transcript_63818/g.201881 Transcript_63818/m.201881 type:complete len:245 (+) Transcript_63818:84-818(+)